METQHLLLAGGVLVALALLGKKASAATPSSGSSGKLPQKLPTPGKLSSIEPIVDRAIARHPELAGKKRAVVGLLWTESRFDPTAVSHTGAVGIGQFTGIGRAQVRELLDTKKYGTKYTSRYAGVPGLLTKLAAFDRDMAFNPDIAIEATCLLLTWSLNRWKGNIEAALTEYNAGGGPAKIVYDAGSHAAAKAKLAALPDNQRSQSPTYAPEVLANAAKYDSGRLA